MGNGTKKIRGVNIIISKREVIPKIPRGFLLCFKRLWQIACESAAINKIKKSKYSGI